MKLGVFGSPTFVVSGEIFWGGRRHGDRPDTGWRRPAHSNLHQRLDRERHSEHGRYRGLQAGPGRIAVSPANGCHNRQAQPRTTKTDWLACRTTREALGPSR